MKFPKLPVLEKLIERILETSPAPLRDVRIVCVQHLLETTGSLLEAMVRLGCAPTNIHVLGKLYSTSNVVEDRLIQAGFDVMRWEGAVLPGRYQASIRSNIERLWNRAHAMATSRDRLILVLDDGGRCRQFCPNWVNRDKVIAVEQTTSGLRRRRTGGWIPTIEVAGSAAKRHLEPPAVTSSILRFVIPRIARLSRKRSIGVIGLGTVGADVARELLSAGWEVSTFDKNPALQRAVIGARWCNSLKTLTSRSPALLGCAGEDLFAGATWIESVTGDKILASCSSEDVEFRSLLRRRPVRGSESGPLSDLVVRLPHGNLTILRAGFPANFTGTASSGPPSLIQVTRALLLAGLVQATTLGSHDRVPLPRRIMLDPAMQALVACSFLARHRKDLVRPMSLRAKEPAWLENESTGIRLTDSV